MDRILLLAAALLWGGTLSAQRISTQFLGAFSFMGVRYLAGFLSMLPIVYWEQRYHNHAIDGVKKAFFSCPSGGNPCHLPYGGDRFSATGNVLHDSGQGGVHYEPLYRHRAVFCLLCGAAPSSDCYHREPPCHDRYVFSCVSYGWSFF